MSDLECPGADSAWAQFARPANLLQFLQTRPPEDPAVSWFARVRMGLPGESWPMTGDRLWWPAMQVNCRELPHLPDVLSNTALLTLFIDPGAEFLDDHTANGDGWLLRAYSSMRDLVELDEPELLPFAYPHNPRYPVSPLRPKPVGWTLIEVDYPGWETLTDMPNWRDIWTNDEDDSPPIQAEGTKIGGWPFEVQNNPWYGIDVEHVIQFDSQDTGWSWGHGGMAFIGRKPDEPAEWFLTWQTL